MSQSATAGFVFNHTMLRVKDLDASLDFYTRVLGFTPVDRREFPQWAFTLQFLALGVDPASIPTETQARRNWMAAQPGLLELTHNHGTETDPAFAYHDGNREPRGFGHICVAVPDIKAACARFDELGVAFQKRLGEGGMKSIAFIKDPDGYWVEIIQLTSVAA
jgi:lactoylglutathione lyase